MHTINCKGLACPGPVIETKKYFDSIETGEACVIVDNIIARNNIKKLCDSLSLNYSTKEENQLFYINIVKQNTNCTNCDVSNDEKDLTILISSDKFGEGNDDLGKTLMKSYLFALSESSTLPKNLIFVNAGVKLTTTGSNCIESLQTLAKKGVNIFNCGTCLDFYNLKEELLVGEISNMYFIVEKLNNASNTIKL